MSETLEFVIEGSDKFSEIFERLLHMIPMVGKAVAVLGTALIATDTALFKISEKAAEAGEHFNNMAMRLGVTTEYIQRLQYQAYLADVPIEQMERSLSRLSVNISEATYKSGPARDAFNDLGISLFDTAGKMKTVEQVVPEVADALSRVGSSARQVELTGALFGQRSIEIIQALKNMGSASSETAEKMQRFGTLMNEQMIANAVKFKDAMKDADTAITGVRNAIAERLMPIFTTMIEGFASFVADNRTNIATWAENAIRATVYFYEVFRRIFVTIKGVIDKVFGGKESFDYFMQNAVIAFEAVLKIGWEFAKFLTLALVTGFKSIWESFVEIGKWAWENLKAWWKGGEIKTLGDLIYGQLVPTFEKAMGEWGEEWDFFIERATPAFKEFSGAINNIAGEDVFSNLGDAVDEIMSKLFKMGTASTDTVAKIKQNNIDVTARLKGIWTDWFGDWTTLLQDVQAMSRNTWSMFSKGVGDAFGNAIVYGKSLQQAMTELFKQIASTIISTLVQIGLKQLAQMIITQTLAAEEASAKLAAYSAETYASVYAANAGTPYVGPYLAAGEAAAAVGMMLAGASASAGMGASLGAGIGAVHGGMTFVPNEETYLLQKGERVLSPNQNKDLTEFIAGESGSGMKITIGAIHVNSPLIKQNWDQIMEKEMVPALNRAIKRNVSIEGVNTRR